MLKIDVFSSIRHTFVHDPLTTISSKESLFKEMFPRYCMYIVKYLFNYAIVIPLSKWLISTFMSGHVFSDCASEMLLVPVNEPLDILYPAESEEFYFPGARCDWHLSIREENYVSSIQYDSPI